MKKTWISPECEIVRFEQNEEIGALLTPSNTDGAEFDFGNLT